MKQTVQERAKEMCEAWGMEDNHGYSVKETFQAGFVQGANWQAEQSPWISINKQFPEDKQHVLCSSPIYGKVVLRWDELSQSWSYPESSEFYCDWYKVDCWMLIPEV